MSTRGSRVARVSGEARAALRATLTRPRYEVLPLAGVVDELVEHVTRTATITVTSSPTRGTEATLDLVGQLTDAGYPAVPHLAARLFHDEVELKEVVDRLGEYGVREVFVVGGDAERPVGRFVGALDLLESLTAMVPGLVVGVTGYPETHPRIPDDVTVQAMWDKRHHASYVVSQICFDPQTVLGWVTRVRRRGVSMPVLLGIPGPAPTGRLLRAARRIGVGESLRFLTSHGPASLRLVGPGGYDPGALLHGLAPALGRPDLGVAGLHVYTFNAIAATERWRQDLVARLEDNG